MAASKGFSLIETLIAVILASIAVLALMQVISRSSRISANVIQRFDDSLLMGLVAGDLNDTMRNREFTVAEMLKKRYTIDHPLILDSFPDETYRVTFYPKETIDPLMNVQSATFDSAAVLRKIAVQKIVIDNGHERKTFFRMTSGTP